MASVVSNSVRPQRWQPTRLPRPWDSPGKNTGVGCHFLLQCMKMISESEVAQSCPTLHDTMDCSLPGSSVHRDSPGKNTEVGCHSLLQGIFPTQGSNPSLLCLLHWQAGSSPPEPPGKPDMSLPGLKSWLCHGPTFSRTASPSELCCPRM